MRPVLIALSKIGERRKTEYKIPSPLVFILSLSKVGSSAILSYVWIKGVLSNGLSGYFYIAQGPIYFSFLALVMLGILPEYYLMSAVHETFRLRGERLYELFYNVAKAFELDPRFSDNTDLIRDVEELKEAACLLKQIKKIPGIMIYLVAVSLSFQLIPLPVLIWSISASLEYVGLFLFLALSSEIINECYEIRKRCLMLSFRVLRGIGKKCDLFPTEKIEIKVINYFLPIGISVFPPLSFPLSFILSNLSNKISKAYNSDLKDEEKKEKILGDVLAEIFRL